MKVIAAITSPAQDDVIEKILRHINQWPSGLCASRKASGPGPRRATAARFPLGSGHFAARQLASQPPWQAQRRARGPPRPTQSSAPGARRPVVPESSDPLPTDEDHGVDPPAPDDFP